MHNRLTAGWMGIFLNTAGNKSFGDLLADLNNGPLYELLEWYVSPLTEEEVAQFKERSHKIYADKMIKLPWTDAFLLHLLPQALFTEVKVVRLRRAIDTIADVYGDKTANFRVELQTVEQSLLERLRLRAETEAATKLSQKKSRKSSPKTTRNDQEQPLLLKTQYAQADPLAFLKSLYPFFYAFQVTPVPYEEKYAEWQTLLKPFVQLAEQSNGAVSEYDVYLSNNRNLDELEIDNLPDFIDHSAHRPSMLAFLWNNPCSAQMKSEAFHTLVQNERFSLTDVFKSNIKEFYELASIRLELNQEFSVPAFDRIKLQTDKWIAMDPTQFLEERLGANSEWKWLYYIEPERLEHLLVSKGMNAREDVWLPILMGLLAAQGPTINAGQPLLQTLYLKYWRYCYKRDGELRSNPSSRPDFLRAYLLLPLKDEEVEEWYRSDKTQRKLATSLQDTIAASNPDQAETIMRLLTRKTLQDQLVQCLRLERSRLKLAAEAANLLEIEFIGLDVDPPQINLLIEQHPERFELEAERAPIEGAEWQYELVSAGIYDRKEGTVVSRAVVRAEIVNSDIVDQLFDDLRFI